MAQLFMPLTLVLLLAAGAEALTVQRFVEAVVFTLAGGAVFFAVVALPGLLITWIWTVRVTPRGVAARSWFGVRRQVRWEDIRAVELTTSGSISYLRVMQRSGGPNVYIPADLLDGRRFDDLVLEYAGPAHPLAWWALPEPVDDSTPAADGEVE